MSAETDLDRTDRPSTAQPAPVHRPGVRSTHDTAVARIDRYGFDLLADLLAERGAFGLAKYGTPLTPGNGRRWDLDALEEVLDVVAYAEQGVREAVEAGEDESPADVLFWRAVAFAEALRVHAARRGEWAVPA